MFDILKDEFNWGMVDAEYLQQYVSWGVITQDQYNSIVTPPTNNAQPTSTTTQQSNANN